MCVHPDGSLGVHVSYSEGDYQQLALELGRTFVLSFATSVM